jgi:hypothetical protein
MCAIFNDVLEILKLMENKWKSPFHNDFIARPPIFRASLLKYYIIHLPQDHPR